MVVVVVMVVVEVVVSRRDGDGESWMNGWSMWWLADDPIDNPTG